ncbi:MAG: DNA-directed RNA polymerase subunit beta' [Lachnospiraceae bacterium]|nr:DNA-directed RNA polymerase subunit beta' [Lachnospiraceae bacterium]
MSETKNETYQPMTFDAIKIGLASPEKIRSWSSGDERRKDDPTFGIVTKPETINYRTLKPEKDGLFCEKIFGPSKDWECHCGKYKKIRHKGIICDRCGVEVTKSSVRRERMGRIELAAPVSHIWYFKGIPSRMGLILDISPKVLEKVLYFASYIVLDPGETSLDYKQVLSEKEYNDAKEEFGNKFRVGMGAEAIKELLQAIDLETEAETLRAELKDSTGQKRARIVKRLEVVEAFRESDNRPEWMIMDVIPVIPPDLRPMVQLDGGRFATSDLNDLYRRIINRNNRLQRLLELGAPEIIVRNEKRMLQEAVDALIDNGRRGRPVTGPGNRALKSLSDLLKGKGGRFRQNLLGKRVDYSGRSVIVVGPELKIYQCGLPKEMAIELFKPFVMKELTNRGISLNIKNAKKLVETLDTRVWDVLEDVIKEHPVMLNRAPTLHRLGIQAFEPILVEGKAIKLHPLVCTAFNADFDGDQMAVHLPLSVEAQAECRFLLLSPNNLLKPSDGGPVAVPSQDMVLGIYYLTMKKYVDHKDDPEFTENIVAEYDSLDEAKAAFEEYNAKVAKAVKGKDEEADRKAIEAIKGVHLDRNSIIKVCVDPERDRRVVCRFVDILGRYYNSMDEALLAYENKEITLQQEIYVKKSAEWEDGSVVVGFIPTTLGRMMFNEVIPQDLGYVDRSVKENILKPEIDFHVGRKQLKPILEKVINTHGASVTAEVLDHIKAMGYHYSTIAAMTVSISDMTVPATKPALLAEAQQQVDKISKNYRRGLTTDEERYRAVVETWTDIDKRLTDDLLNGLDKYNNIFMMADSGARGSNQQIKQLAGMRGLMADTSGRTIELPIKSNFREGLDVLEYFMSAHGARKGLSDTAIRTADSGYLTRRMVDVSQELIIREIDCCEGKDKIPGMDVYAFMDGKETIEGLKDRIQGRYAAEDILSESGDIIVKKNHMINPSRAARIMKEGVDTNGNPINMINEDGERVFNPASRIKVRNILCCRSHDGICAKCYGANMATGEMVQVGEAVGIIAAQSIGEPGTQLTMRTFHTGGVAGGDITQGLPRVEELFEARRPKGLAILSEDAGVVSISDTKKKREVTVTNPETGEQKYLIPYGSRIKVQDGQVLEAGDVLTEGSINPHDLLKVKGIGAVEDYLLREVQRVYRLQGVDINDKHIEVIVRQMIKKIRIENTGDSEFLPGTLVDYLDFEDMNEALVSEGKQPAEGTRIILGITKSALATESFLSAASFQETTKVLTEAAIKGKVDRLIGLKENVILGKLIPAGTGMKRYRDVELSTDKGYEAMLSKKNSEAEKNVHAEQDDNEPDADEITDEDLGPVEYEEETEGDFVDSEE